MYRVKFLFTNSFPNYLVRFTLKATRFSRYEKFCPKLVSTSLESVLVQIKLRSTPTVCKVYNRVDIQTFLVIEHCIVSKL